MKVRKFNNNKIELPSDIKNKLINIPENGIGYHTVDIILKNGDVLENRVVFNSSYLLLSDGEKLKVSEIEYVDI